jgi:hypothetical protein
MIFENIQYTLQIIKHTICIIIANLDDNKKKHYT